METGDPLDGALETGRRPVRLQMRRVDHHGGRRASPTGQCSEDPIEATGLAPPYEEIEAAGII